MLKIADILSDLTSLRVGDPTAALDLVLARPPSSVTAISTELQRAQNATDSDVDLARARDLLDLHANVKLAHRDRLDHALLEARQRVDMVLKNV